MVAPSYTSGNKLAPRINDYTQHSVMLWVQALMACGQKLSGMAPHDLHCLSYHIVAEHKDCHRKLETLSGIAQAGVAVALHRLLFLLPICGLLCLQSQDLHVHFVYFFQSFRTEEDLLQAAQSDVAQLCAENVILWMQYLELVSFNEKITHQLAREHHVQRVSTVF